MSETRLRSCLILASRATFRGEAEAAYAAAGRIIAAHNLGSGWFIGSRTVIHTPEDAAAWFGINLDMGRFDREANASKPGDNARANDTAQSGDIELNAKQRRILRTKFNGSNYVNAHRPGSRWSLNDMPENIKKALGL